MYSCFSAVTRIGFEQVRYSEREDAGIVSLMVRSFTSSGILSQNVDVTFSTSPDSAVGG